MRKGFAYLFLVVGLVSLACNIPATPSVLVPITGSPAALTPTAQVNEPPQASETPLTGDVPQTLTPSAGQDDENCSYLITFVADVTVPDDTIFRAGEAFTKTWRVRNDGTCTWGPNRSLNALVFANGDRLTPINEVPLEQEVPPGEELDVSVDMVAPTQPGTYTSQWKFRLLNPPEGMEPVIGVGEDLDGPLFTRIHVEEALGE
ncbi:MAG: hypothetical protein GX491_00265 [Chloroflexi bacterium]|nr:hypothetical protein [Chloroflexota bacterium]